MPSPTTPRRSTNRGTPQTTPSKAAQSAAAIALKGGTPSSVKDRIRQWQDQGGGVATPLSPPLGGRSNNLSLPLKTSPPAPSPEKIEKPQAKPSPKPAVNPEPKSAAEPTTSKIPNTKRWVDHEKREWVREKPRSRSAPRKRIVSDEHWKKSRTSTPREEKSVPTTPVLGTPTRTRNDRRQVRERRRGRQKEKEEEGTQESDHSSEEVGLDEDSIRVFPTAPRTRKPPPINFDDIIVELESEVQASQDGRLEITPPRHYSSPRKHRDIENLDPEEDDGRSRRKTSYAEALDAESERAASIGKVGSQRKRGGIIGQIFSKPEPVPTSAPKVPTIEAWLNEQPDPFVDNATDAGDIPAPLKTNARDRQSVSERNPSSSRTRERNDSELHEEPEQHDSGHRRRRRQRKSIETDLQRESPPPRQDERDPTASEIAAGINRHEEKESSPSTLKRRGAAKGQRVKSRTRSVNMSDRESTSPRTQRLASPAEQQYDFLNHPPADLRPRPPTGGRPLSTIASVETFQTNVDSDVVDDLMLATGPNELKRRLTTHDDLMSVLSLPTSRRGSKKIRSARSVRSARIETPRRDISQVLDTLADDENKYMRELKTLVDGVIPVLLKSMLSKSDWSKTAGLFGASPTDDHSKVTKPIMDMGIALERLKSLHKRIPLGDADSLLTWAQGAQKVYLDYIQSWRMGFQDVIVNLTPAETQGPGQSKDDGGMERDADGDVIDAEGKKADVAHLLKRPLLRLKGLSKTFQQVAEVVPSEKANATFREYQELVDLARRRSNEERGRLEDEAAAKIDPSKVRDTRTLAVMENVVINKNRKVRARDYFDLTVQHSSGQRIDCRAELLLRDNDNPSRDGGGGDLLLCEIDDTSRWLLFPPLISQCLSARAGDSPTELVLMIRGSSAHGVSWHELLSLRTDDSQTCLEWIEMLGTDPIPPKLVRTHSFINRQVETTGPVIPSIAETTTQLSRTPSPTNIEVPIGEPSVLSMRDERRRTSPTEQWFNSHEPPTPPRAHESPGLVDSPFQSTTPTKKPLLSRLKNFGRSSSPEKSRSPFSLEGTTEPLTPSSPHGVRRKKVIRKKSMYDEDSRPSSPRTEVSEQSDATTPTQGSFSVLETQGKVLREDIESSISEDPLPAPPVPASRPDYNRSPSSTPSRQLPSIPRIRPTSYSHSTPLNDSMREDWETLSGLSSISSDVSSVIQPTPKDQRRSTVPENKLKQKDDKPPPPPPHRSPTASQVSLPPGPVLKPQLPISPDKTLRPRSSSPLKNEYAPSTASDTYSDTDSMSDSTSDTSEDELEADDVPGALPDFGTMKRKLNGVPSSKPTVASTSLAPSDSASQAPYRKVPTQETKNAVKTIATVYYWSDRGCWNPIHGDECSIQVSPGLIQAFEMTAAHSGDHIPNSTNSVSDTSSSTYEHSGRPLIGLELTPLVPLRRGTALDISIRSPPTDRSKFKSSNNIMLRSRNAEECDALYAMINYARINNPTYIALQNARPSYQPPVSFNTGIGQGARHSMSSKRSSSWIFGGGAKRSRPSYRASSAPTGPSIAAGSDNSAGTVSSALRRLSGSGVFNLTKSTVLKKAGGPGTATASLYSSDSGGTKGGSGSSTPVPGMGQASMGGINNLKIRLYIREDQNRWRDMGAARLTVLSVVSTSAAAITSPLGGGSPVVSPPMSPPISEPPPTSSSQQLPGTSPLLNRTSAGAAPRLPSANHSPHRLHHDGREKRILITTSKKPPPTTSPNPSAVGTLLDVCLGESCFERVARTGIAISVWEEHEEGVVPKEGGVVNGRGRVYMVQCSGEAEAGWVFGVVGGNRY